jgi:hypothetical protein
MILEEGRKDTMKKLLLAGVAVLLMATSASAQSYGGVISCDQRGDTICCTNNTPGYAQTSCKSRSALRRAMGLPPDKPAASQIKRR